MRTTSLPQPGVNLADDPDLVADLGQRMAAAAHTAQGALANYLFHGERRATAADRDERAGAAFVRDSLTLRRGPHERPDSARSPGAGPDSPGTPGSEPAAAAPETSPPPARPRVALHVVPTTVDPIDSKVARLTLAESSGQATSAADPLAGDALAGDALDLGGRARLGQPSLRDPGVGPTRTR